MYLHGGTVGDLASAFDHAPDDFLARSVGRFRTVFGQEVRDSELASWRESWPALFRMLRDAGLEQVWMALEYELPGSGERVDALLLAVDEQEALTAIVVELKQWAEISRVQGDHLRYAVFGRVAVHPCFQAAGYIRYLEQWVDPTAVPMTVRGVAVLHNAPPELVDELRTAVSGQVGSGDVPVLGKDDLAALTPAQWTDHLGCGHLKAPTSDQVRRFEAARHQPAQSLFDQLDAVLDGDPAFVLIGEQQRAQLELLRRFQLAWRNGSRHVIAVTGGPGTGKTVIAARLLAAVPAKARQLDVPCTARYLTPSGTLRRQLERAAKDHAAKGLFVNLQRYLTTRVPEGEVVIVDEAQRISAAHHTVPKLLKRTRVSIFFLDERQIIRPQEGITVTQLATAANQAGAGFTHIDLTSQFRCGGSQRYMTWLDEVLSPAPAPKHWDSQDYDLAVVDNPVQLQAWVDDHTARNNAARMVAGFCWDWDRNRKPGRPLLDEVTINWTDGTGRGHIWQRPWNSQYALLDGDGMPIAPRTEYWATDPGGHNQVGCIYTAQGLEYPYNAVILGPDLVRRGEQWVGCPDRSKDPVMRDVSAEDYRRLAFNIYRVLLTRGTRGCRLYSTDPETQAFLRRLLPARS